MVGESSDAYYFGPQVITVLNLQQLNLSPLRDVSGVCFVRHADDLCEVFHSIAANKKTENKEQGTFYFSCTLKQWHKTLSNFLT